MRCLMTRTPYQAEPPLVQLLFNISTLHNCVTTIATLQSLGWFSGQAPATELLGLQSTEVLRAIVLSYGAVPRYARAV